MNRQLLSAEIYLDNKLIGMTPLSIRNITAGPHQLQARASGFQPRSREITVKAQSINSFVLTLERAQK